MALVKEGVPVDDEMQERLDDRCAVQVRCCGLVRCRRSRSVPYQPIHGVVPPFLGPRNDPRAVLLRSQSVSPVPPRQ